MKNIWIHRNQASIIEEAVHQRPVVFLGGMRQVGKSSLLKRLYPDAHYISLDKSLIADEARQAPERFLNALAEHERCIIDEIQYAPELFKAIKRWVDANRHIPAKWILTGSQYFQLMQGVSESLAGRIRILQLLPLSALELREAKVFDQNEIDMMLWKGGFPELWATEIPISPIDFYEDYAQTYLERDLRQLIKVQQLADFRRFMSTLSLHVGQMLNFSTISRTIGVSVNTIKAWTNTLEVSGIITLLPTYHKNLGKRLVKSPKLYFNDNGLLCTLLSIESNKGMLRHPLYGAIWENYVLTELLKSGLKAGKNLFYFRDQNGLEMDFVVEKDAQLQLIESKLHPPRSKKELNFEKVSATFASLNIETSFMLASQIDEDRVISMKDYQIYNPLRCHTQSTEL